MTVAIYIRVSTEEQALQGFSIDVQKERLVAFCKAQGWDNFKLYIDDGYTGTNMNRPALNRLIRHIEMKQIETVVVFKLDRLSRKQIDVLHLLEDVFEKNGVSFKSATEPFDTSTPLGKAILGILAVFAQLERDMIVERTTEGRRQRINQGLWYGGREPFGYKWNKEMQQLEIVPEEARLVRAIYKKYLQGESRLAIAEWVSERTNARVFDHSVILDILTRPIYIGMLPNLDSLVEGNHKAIIDFETWQNVQREIERRKDGLSPSGDYLLTGLLECGECGSNIVHVKRKKKTTEEYYEFYTCKEQHVRPKDRRTDKCSLGYQHRRDVEKYVITQISDLALNPKKINSFFNNKIEEHDDRAVTADRLKEQLEKIITGLENLYEAIQIGEIKVQYVSERIKRLEKEREMIETQLEDIADETPKYKDTKEIQLFIQEINRSWKYLNEHEQKIVLRKIIKKVILNKSASPKIIWNLTK